MKESEGTGSYEKMDYSSQTGGTLLSESPDFEILERTYGRYNVKIMVTIDGKFLDIAEIKLNKDFLSLQQRNTSKGYHEVEEFYK